MKIKKELITFIITFVITCIIFLPFLTGHYATDTYNIWNIGYEDYAINWSLKDGRLIMAIIGLIAAKINISIKSYVFVTLFIALIISNITVSYLSNIIKKYKQPKNIIQEIVIILISYITIFNFMYLEDMYFVESIVMAISVLLFIVSANILVEKNKFSIIKSLLLTIVGIICYQGTIGMLFAFVILFTILKNKNNVKQILIDLVKSGVIALIAVILNIITVKIVGYVFSVEQTRLGNISKIFTNIQKIILKMPQILQETCNLFPKNALIIFLNILTLIVVIHQIKLFIEKNENNILYKYIAIVVITVAASCVTYILTLTSFYTGRLRNALGALIGIIFIFLYVETELFEKKRILSILVYFTLIFYIIINIFNYENIMLQHKEVNKLEKQEIEQIGNYIENYEKDTGIEITKVVKIPKKNSNKKDENDIIRNALKTNWAADGVLNFYLEKNLTTVKLTKEQVICYSENCDKEKEYQCIDDTLYICVYVY